MRFLTFADDGGRRVFNHTASHILAQAVKRIWPDAELAIGPAIEDGFYYDILFPQPISTEDLPRILDEMRRVVAEDHPESRRVIGRDEALQIFEGAGEPFKVELIRDLPADAVITMYRQGEFEDLCRGPHLVRTGLVKAIALTSLAGAYWRGDEKRPMLQRIYGTAFPSEQELEHHLWLVEEAKRRDHRKLGPELDLFSFHQVAPGFTFWHKRGLKLYDALVGFSKELQEAQHYQEVATPWIMRFDLWERSGHAQHYRDNMFLIPVEGETFGAKPMNCPAHCLIFGETTRSYRDLPMRLAEYGPLSRYERSGTLHGLLRVRGMHQDDAHIFCTPEQVGSVAAEVLDLVATIYGTLGLPYDVQLSTRPEDHMGAEELWEAAEHGLVEVLEGAGLAYVRAEGEGAFYGPKLDFHVTDALGRRWQCATLQLDFQTPLRFELHYVDRDGQEKSPVMIHRAIMGTIERFLGILIEHFAGAFPVWLAPEQVRVLPITSDEVPYAGEVAARMRRAGLRADVDSRDEKVGFKIRSAQLQKVPYMAIVGKREAASGQVAVRQRGEGDLGPQDLETFIDRVRSEAVTRSLEAAGAKAGD